MKVSCSSLVPFCPGYVPSMFLLCSSYGRVITPSQSPVTESGTIAWIYCNSLKNGELCIALLFRLCRSYAGLCRSYAGVLTPFYVPSMFLLCSQFLSRTCPRKFVRRPPIVAPSDEFPVRQTGPVAFEFGRERLAARDDPFKLPPRHHRFSPSA